MAFRPVQDKMQGRSSRVIESFYGAHYRWGKPDQPDNYAATLDLDYVHKKPTLRMGSRKNMLRGLDEDIAGLVHIQIGGFNLLGEVHGGQMDVFPVTDVLVGRRKYYTVREVNDTFTVEELTGKTLRELDPGTRT